MKKIILLQFFLFNTILFANAQCWKYIAGNGTHTLGIKTDSTLWAWGYNDYGQLGNGSNAYGYAPTKVGSASGWQVVAAGYDHSLGIKDGMLWAWGSNFAGELGNGSYNSVSSPEQIGTNVNWVFVSCGLDFSTALNKDGTIWAWGGNNYEQLGDGTFSHKKIPTQVGTGTDWQSIAAGDNFCLAIKNDGTLWGWGDNEYGTLGIGNLVSIKIIPIQIGTDNDWKTVSAGASHSLALKNDGTIWGWGSNRFQQLGITPVTTQYTPTRISSDNDWQSIAAGGIHSIALKTNGTLWSWGGNNYGQLGSGVPYNIVGDYPGKINNATDWKSIFGALRYTQYAIKIDSTLWGWGAAIPIANGPLSRSSVPVQIFCGNSLPIILTYFTGQKQETRVLFNWQTATEQNNKEFQIERRTDGTNFEKIGIVESKNNIAGSSYTYVDAYPLSGNNYYRLKSVDIDEKYSYSNIVEITFNLALNQVIIFPNPAKDILKIQSNLKGEKLYITITDLAGRKILQTARQNNPLLEIPAYNLKAGFYLLKVSDGVNFVSKKIIKE